MKRQHNSNDSNSDEKKSKHVCSICSKQFVLQKYLEQHMQTHKQKLTCPKCEKKFSFRSSLVRHTQRKHQEFPVRQCDSKRFPCATCSKSYNRKYHLDRHVVNAHPQREKSFTCRHCRKECNTYGDLVNHVEQHHPLINQHGGRQRQEDKSLRDNDLQQSPKDSNENDNEDASEANRNNQETDDAHAMEDQSALENNVQNRSIYPRQGERFDLLVFFSKIREQILNYLSSRLQQLRGMKWNLCVQVELRRDDGNEGSTSSPYFRSKTYRTLTSMDEHDLNEAFQKMFASLEKYMREGSGWFLSQVIKLEIHTITYKPISASTFIPLPVTLSKSNSVLNIRNDDNRCFLYCILAALHPKNVAPDLVDNYFPYMNELNMDGIEYPVSIADVKKFEMQNGNISINIFSFDDGEIIPMRITSFTERLHHINLLWIKNENTAHYCLIKDLNRFLSRTKSHHGKYHFCSYCLHGFTTEDLLDDHQKDCCIHGAQKVILPSTDAEATLYFKEYEKTLKVPFVIYADFETINIPIHTCMPNPKIAATTPTKKLEVCSFSYKVISEDSRYSKSTVTYRGKNAERKLIECLLEERKEILEILSLIEPLPDHEGLIENATECCLCKKRFTPYDRAYNLIVLHHNHLTGSIIGPACNNCNLNCKQEKFTPVIFHNLKDFDSHILCESLGQFKDHKLTCIAQNSERYISFTLGGLRFIDSLGFLSSSLGTLVDDLQKDGKQKFQHMISEFKESAHIDLLLRKGVFPYDYLDDVEKFDETELPPIEEFYSALKQESITELDYHHAQNVFKQFNLSSLGEYHDLYLKTDVILLADVFESFRKVCLEQYELDPCHFYTAPGLAWSALLKKSNVRLELLSDISMLLMVEAGIKGGLSQISNRHRKSNNPYVKDYNPSEPTSYITYLDANNLYGWAMAQPLPVCDFRFLNDVEEFDVMSIPEEGPVGYIIEVSLHYPRALHDHHNCLPLAPERKVISNDELSPYAKALLRKLHNKKDDDPLPPRGNIPKLLTTLGDKDHYVLHYRNLQLYLSLGMEIKTIHRILQFRQEAWMKPYIDFNTEKRKQATSTFERGFYKMMVVSVFGKTMENVRKHRNIELTHTEERLRKLSAKPTYKHTTIFNEDLVAVELLKSKAKLFKPSYCGMCVLATKLPTPTTPGRGYEIYNMTITGLVGNLLITPAFNFTVHGNPKLELENNSNTALVLDCSKHQYVELADKSIPCLQDLDKCAKGFTFKLEAMFTKLVPSEKTYILSSGGDDAGHSGMSVYLHSGLLTYGVKTGMWHWAASTNVQNTIKTNTWYTFEISWSESKGLLVLIDGYQVLQSNDTTPSPGAAQSNPVLIGKSPNNNYTSCMKVRNLYSWTIEREVLVTSGILPALQPLPITMTTNKGPMKLTPYDLTFLRVDDNQIVYTSSFLFQGHGNIPSPPKGVSIITLRGVADQYMAILNRSIICLDDIKRCNSGFSIEISLQVFMAIPTDKTFIFSSTDENQTGGVYLFYQNGYLFYGFRYENKLWSGSVKYNLLDYQWHSFILSWSKSDGVILFEKYKVISQTLEAIQQTSSHTVIGTFTIGRGHGQQNSMFQVNNLKFWPYSMGFLIEHNVYTTISTSTAAPTKPSTSTTMNTTNFPSTPTINTFLSEIQFVNMTILGQIGDIIITSTYNITYHGSVSLVNDSIAQQMIRIDMSKGGYLEINASNIVCLGSIQRCNSFTLSLDIKIYKIGNNSMIGFISKSPSLNNLGIKLYYQSSTLHFEVTKLVEKQMWIGSFPFPLTLKTWNTFELKWSETAGVWIYVNKTLLYHGTEKHEFSSESLQPPTPLTIGNTESHFTDAIFYVKNITFGNFFNVSNSYTTKTTHSGTSTIQQPETSSSTTKYTSIDQKASSNPTTKQQYIVTKNPAPTNTMAPTTSHPINYFLQLNISGNKIYTDKINLIRYGSVELTTSDNDMQVIKINTSNVSYLKVDTNNASCMVSYDNCNDSLSVAANISCIDLQINQTVFIISNIVKGTNVPQIYLYYISNHLYFGLKVKNRTWSGNVDFSLNLNHWYSFDISFTPGYGLGLFVNGLLLRLVTEQTSTNLFLISPSIATGFTVGQTLKPGNTAILIGGLNISPTISLQLDGIKPLSLFFNDTYTSGATFHGKIDLVNISATGNAIKINGSVGSYIEIDSSTNVCLTSLRRCVNGFSIEIGINLISIENHIKVYFILNETPSERFYVYYLNMVLYFGLTNNSSTLAGKVSFGIKVNEWNTYSLSWSNKTGLDLYINGYLEGHAIKSLVENIQSPTKMLSVGKSNGTYGALLVNKIQIWSMSYDLLVKTGIKALNISTTDPMRPTISSTPKSSKPMAITTTHVANRTLLHQTSLQTNKEHYSTLLVTNSKSSGTTTSNSNTTTISAGKTPVEIASTSSTAKFLSGSASVKLPATSPFLRHSKTSLPPTMQSQTTLPQRVQNFAFLNITGDKIFTSHFTFTAYGNPEIINTETGENVVKLNASTGTFLQIDNHNLTCSYSESSCKGDITIGLNLNIINIKQNQTLYIMSNTVETSSKPSLFVYFLNNKIYFGSRFDNITVSSSVKYNLVFSTWHTIQISISKTYETVGLIIDGHLVKYVTAKTTTNHFPNIKTTSLTIGQTLQNDFITTVLIGGINIWQKVSQILVEGLSIQATPTTAKSTTTSTSTTTTTTTTTTTPTTTPQPIPTFHWNLTTIPISNVIIGQIFNLTIHGTPIKTNTGLVFKNTTQFIDLGQIKCLLNPLNCVQGLTVQFMINVNVTSENTYLLTSGGELPNGIGIAVIYRYGQYQFVLTTSTQSWYANCGKDILTPNEFHLVMITWKENIGLEIIVDNKQVEIVNTAVNHQVSITTSTLVYFGKQPSSTVKYEYILQTVSIWYAHVDILVIEGLCPKPDRPEKPTPTTPVLQTTPKPSTSVATSYTAIISTKPGQCPVGCVEDKSTSKPAVTATSKSPSTEKPTTKKPPPTTKQTPPSTKQTTPTTTERGAPPYTTTLTITVTVQKTDNKAYLVCAFRQATEAGIEMKVALLVENKRILVTTVAGNEGIATFAVSQVNMDLYGKKIQCSLVANYVGSSQSTHVFISNTYIPKVTVTPSKITVTEGYQGKQVTVQSTAPPHLFCCKGCKGQCQVHIVGMFIYNRKDQRCNNYNYISQAVIESSKPPNYNKEICGFALTTANWKNENNILVVATLDNRRDGTQKRELKVKVNVYNQPPNMQITDRPVTHTLSPHVQVTVLDNYHSPYNCKSINDPHMLTFDGSHYNNMNEGQFVMFKHKDLPFEVRTWYHKCSKRSHATCNCGVAIKSGDDVISVIGCHTITSGGHHGHGHGIGLIFQQLFGHLNSKDEFAKTPMTIQIYKNGELTPGTLIRRYGCGQKYEIQLPTGMIITVQQSYKPFINVWIKASSYDRNKATGLCGNYNGKRDEWSGSKGLIQFINSNKAPTDSFFNGVGSSAVSTGSMYCSCVENKGSICTPGLGVMQCTKSRYDITLTLLRQAKTPILTVSRQKRQVQTTDVPQTITQDNNTMSLDAARGQCFDTIMNNTVTTSCQPILTTNLTQQVENCAYDYEATGNFEWAASALSDIVVDCVDTANALLANNDTDGENNVTEPVDIPDNIDDILNKACLEDCGENGECKEGICECNDGFTGDKCEISSNTKPTISSIPVLCDISNTLDCMGAVVYGNDFVNSTTITCHFGYIEVTDSIHTTGQTRTIPATFISINQVICQIPQLRSTQIRVSNNGQTLSDAISPHVVYNSACFDCNIVNDTNYKPYCSRKNNNCVINGGCYENGSTKHGDICSVCNPVVNDTEWSLNRERAECTARPVAVTSEQKKDDENKIIALAVVSAVLAAILLLLLFYIVRSRSTSKSKSEFGEYQVTPDSKLHREDPYVPTTTMDNPIYSDESVKL